MLGLGVRFSVVGVLLALCGLAAGGFRYWAFVSLSLFFVGLSVVCMLVDVRRSRISP